jgi:hypothetical protein
LAWLNSILRERVTLHIKNSASYFAIVFARRGKKKFSHSHYILKAL